MKEIKAIYFNNKNVHLRKSNQKNIKVSTRADQLPSICKEVAENKL